MKYPLSKEQMYMADNTAMEEYGVASPLLMENAAHSAASIFREIFPTENTQTNVLIFCGTGNNGGDGFAIARHLCEDYNVYIFWLGEETKMSPETKANFESCIKLGIYTQHIEEDDTAAIKINYEADCIIDAMTGIGAGENLRGQIVPILHQINGSSAVKVAIDMPSGLNPDTGLAHTDAFRADHTITMFTPKKGMYLGEGINLCGEIHTANLGVPQRIVNELSETRIIEDADLEKLLPKRNRISSKFNYGRVLCIGGCKSMPGAITLTANAAIASGAGLVEVMTTVLHPALMPEVMPTILKTDDEGYIDFSNLDRIFESADRADSIAVGPGMGRSLNGIKIVLELIERYKDSKTLVIDADALRAISNNSKLTKNVILTPHILEFARSFEMPIKDVTENADIIARETAKKLNCTLLIKHIPTIITDGEETFFNITGNPGMATAGSGDVLTGIIVALTAQKESRLMATALSAFIHSRAGDIHAKTFGQLSLTASEIIDSLKVV